VHDSIGLIFEGLMECRLFGFFATGGKEEDKHGYNQQTTKKTGIELSFFSSHIYKISKKYADFK